MNIDPALPDNSMTPNPLTNQFISQDGSATDGNSMPAGEPVPSLAVLSIIILSEPATEPIVQPADLGHVGPQSMSMGVAWEWTP